MIRAVFPKVLAADHLITASAVPAARPAALVAEEFHLVFFRPGKRFQLGKGLIEPEIRHHIGKILPGRLLPERFKLREDFGGGRDEIKLRVVLFQVARQQVGMDDDAVLRAAAFCQQPAKRIAALVRQMLLSQQRVAEC